MGCEHAQVDPLPDPLPSDCARKVVFVTSTSHRGGELGGLTGAGSLCQSRSSAAGLTGTFLAWLATPAASPANRFHHSAVP